MVNFIEIYDDALDEDSCCEIIQKFETSDQIKRGRTGQGIDLIKKDSYDFTITGHAEWGEIERRVLKLTFGYLKKYLQKYIFALVGAVSPSVLEPKTRELVTLTQQNWSQ